MEISKLKENLQRFEERWGEEDSKENEALCRAMHYNQDLRNNLHEMLKEKESLRRLHDTGAFDDPALNPGYEKGKSNPGLQIPRTLAAARLRGPSRSR